MFNYNVKEDYDSEGGAPLKQKEPERLSMRAVPSRPEARAMAKWETFPDFPSLLGLK
jgi:hypothetical protein